MRVNSGGICTAMDELSRHRSMREYQLGGVFVVMRLQSVDVPGRYGVQRVSGMVVVGCCCWLLFCIVEWFVGSQLVVAHSVWTNRTTHCTQTDTFSTPRRSSLAKNTTGVRLKIQLTD
jgi:hypothetical protein